MSVTRAQRISRAIASRSLAFLRPSVRNSGLRSPCATGDSGPPANVVPASARLWGDLAKTDLAVAIDGGRMNIRTAKPGRVAADRSRHGYHTDWREPKLYIIYLVGKGGRL